MAKYPTSATDLKAFFSHGCRRKTKAFAYGFFLTFLACTAYIAFSPSFSSSSLSSYRSHLDSFLATASSYSSHFSFFSSLFPNSTTTTNTTTTTTNTTTTTTTNTTTTTTTTKPSSPKWNIETMASCNLFHGKWVREESYPMYPPGSCPYVGESFDCFGNGRPEHSYMKLRWQPHGCYIPRFNATDMLERLRGKRLAFVGDSLNRNMWESLVCILFHSVDDKTRVLELSAKHQLKTDTSFSVLFKDYNCTVEFFRSVFLVQEWEMTDTGGNEKETLRLDMIAKSSSRYKDADIIVFNTGHWWTHEKTSKGKDYYQEGNHVYGQLNVVEAFHKALETWARWVDKNVDHRKTIVFFRGYSSSHFKGGRWNSGGQCDGETEPIKNETYLAPYPPKMDVLESVLRGMKTPVVYLNITRMTDYRKDGHPSVYRKPNLTKEEKWGPDRFQDCSHWCLPGVPDAWNDLLYSLLLIKQHRPQ